MTAWPSCDSEGAWRYGEWLALADRALDHGRLDANAIWRLHETTARRYYATEAVPQIDLGGEA